MSIFIEEMHSRIADSNCYPNKTSFRVWSNRKQWSLHEEYKKYVFSSLSRLPPTMLLLNIHPVSVSNKVASTMLSQ